MLRFIILIGLIATVNALVAAEAPLRNDIPLQASRGDLQWFLDAKLGMFIHWGPCTVKGTEISWSRGKTDAEKKEYDSRYMQFNPSKFNADEWVSLAKDAGAQYVVFTCKHMDGFCNFSTAETDYKIANSPFMRDITKELVEACHKAGLKFGVYYCLTDIYHPDYNQATHQNYIQYVHKQLRELCSQYGKIDMIWFDYGDGVTNFDNENLIRMIRGLQPGILINNRLRGKTQGDYSTPEGAVGGFDLVRPWEMCMSLTWGWSWHKGFKVIGTLKTQIEWLVRSVGNGGNMLLNISPDAAGEIEKDQIERMREIGKWMNVYGDSVRGTRGGPIKPGTWGVSVCKGNMIYLHVLDWTGGGPMFPDLGVEINSCRVMGAGAAQLVKADGMCTLSVKPEDVNEIDTIIVLELKSPADKVKLVSSWSKNSLAYQSKCTASFSIKDHPAEYALDGDASTYWDSGRGTDKSDDAAAATLLDLAKYQDPGKEADNADGSAGPSWVEIDIGERKTINRAVVQNDGLLSAKKFEVWYLDGDKWKAAKQQPIKGENPANWRMPVVIRFEPVNTNKLRVLPKTGGAQNRTCRIAEFEVFAVD